MKKLTKFYADWCGPCKALTASLEFLLKQNPGVYELEQVNVDDEPARAQQNRVQALPTLIIMDELGLEVDRVIGNASLPKLREKLGLSDAQINDQLPI